MCLCVYEIEYVIILFYEDRLKIVLFFFLVRKVEICDIVEKWENRFVN